MTGSHRHLKLPASENNLMTANKSDSSQENAKIKEVPHNLTKQLESLSREQFLALIPQLAAMLKTHGTQQWWMREDVFAGFEEHGIHVSQDSFYSAIPNRGERAFAEFDCESYSLDTLEVDMPAMLSLWHEIETYMQELSGTPVKAKSGYYWDNYMYPNMDAVVYYGLLRKYRPNRVLEVGAGFSTHISSRALAENGSGELHVIEPYPTPTLELLQKVITKQIVAPVQNVPLSVFEELRSGDFLYRRYEPRHQDGIRPQPHPLQSSARPAGRSVRALPRHLPSARVSESLARTELVLERAIPALGVPNVQQDVPHHHAEQPLPKHPHGRGCASAWQARRRCAIIFVDVASQESQLSLAKGPARRRRPPRWRSLRSSAGIYLLE